MSRTLTRGPLSLLVLLASAGCPEPTPTADVDWHRHAAPIVLATCAGCHTDGGVAPFALDSYETAAPLAGWIADTVAAQTMPPWGLGTSQECSQERPVHGDPSLTDTQIETLRVWADNDAPLGDPSLAAPIPEAPTFSMSDPTRQILPESAYTVQGDGDDFRCVVYDPELTSTVWITGMEVLPDATEVVHHALVWLDQTGASRALADEDGGYPCFGSGGIPDGKMIGGWVPSSGAVEYPENSGLEAPPGSLVVVQYHYFGNGTDTPDSSALNLRWTDSEPDQSVRIVLEGNASTEAQGLQPGENDMGPPVFRIPAGDSRHTEVVRWQVPEGMPEARLFLVGPHMHLAGVEMNVRIERGGSGQEPENECLIHAPRYDFNWQRLYRYDTPLEEVPRIQGGDAILLECIYDNSLENPRLREALTAASLSAPVDIFLGDGSLDEMCIAALGVVY